MLSFLPRRRIYFIILLVLVSLLKPQKTLAQSSSDWYMAGANPQRTSWSLTEVRTPAAVVWYRPIEAYIDQKVQLIAANGMIYVSTSRGLVALDAANGSVRWRYDTQLPLGNSPTVDISQNPAVLYVGGFDKKLHALNANTGQLLWTFDGAKAGYNTNPLVVEGKVILGNRDGALYAIGAQGSAQQGQQVWKFQTGGPINFSAAYKDGIAYIASNDQYAYAVRVNNGSQVWRSAKLRGDGFHSYFPVIYRDKVIFTSTQVTGSHVENEFRMQNVGSGVYEPIIPGDPLASGVGGLIGTVEGVTSWSNGFGTLYPWRVLEHYENNPDGDLLFHRPQDRIYLVLNQSDGHEFTFDSDGDGFDEYIPFTNWQRYGTQYPPIVDLNDGLAYASAPIACCSDAKGKFYGWNLDVPSRLSIVGANSSTAGGGSIGQGGGWAAVAEPQARSGGGSVIYRSLCCDRVGDWFNSVTPQQSGQFWSYNLGSQIPGYDFLWTLSPVSISRHVGWYSGNYTTGTGVYHSHGDQAPLIPYNGRVYAHRSNVIIAHGSGTQAGQLPTVSVNSVTESVATPSDTELKARLGVEVQKIVDVNGHLRPGWNVGELGNYGGNREGFEDYFSNPGDTLFTLSYAYPYLSSALQQQVANYLSQRLIPDYFDPTMYAKMGYQDGVAREWFDIPSDLFSTFQPQQKTTAPGSWSFTYPQHNFYALYLYAKNVPGVNVARMYTLAKSKLRVPANVSNESTVFTQDPFEHNAWITGYHGFLKLQELANMQQTDAALRNSVIAERDRLIALRNTLFNKETAWVDLQADTANNYKKSLDIARNFMFLSPELAADYRNNSQLMQKAQDALTMYEYIAPFWFVGLYEAMPYEGINQNLYSLPALFQAKAWILRQSREELYKYLDTPMFARGDLFYIQNLVATIEAPLSGTQPTNPPSSPTPTSVPGDANGDRLVDEADYQIWLNHYNQSSSNGSSDGDFNNDNVVDGVDYVIWLNNYGS